MFGRLGRAGSLAGRTRATSVRTTAGAGATTGARPKIKINKCHYGHSTPTYGEEMSKIEQ